MAPHAYSGLRLAVPPAMTIPDPRCPPLVCARPACIGVLGQACTATFLLRFLGGMMEEEIRCSPYGEHVEEVARGRTPPGNRFAPRGLPCRRARAWGLRRLWAARRPHPHLSGL